MLMKYQYVQLYQDLYIRIPLILEVFVVMFSMTYPPWNSRTENNLNIKIAEI